MVLCGVMRCDVIRKDEVRYDIRGDGWRDVETLGCVDVRHGVIT